MSILFKGKRMPTCCVACWAAEICRHYDRFSNYERPEHCPLVEVPEPHGDLIDRDLLCDDLYGIDGYTEKAIDDAPTVIEAEEQEHGNSTTQD